MPTLDKTLRSQLERDIKKARGIAETAARAALEQLGVGEAAPFEYLNEDSRALRRKLRAHGRQLGDPLHSDNVQELDRLIEEVAYEHWHRMLFARFLAENDLLMYPDPDDPVAITLENATTWPLRKARSPVGNWLPALPPICCRRSFDWIHLCSS